MTDSISLYELLQLSLMCEHDLSYKKRVQEEFKYMRVDFNNYHNKHGSWRALYHKLSLISGIDNVDVWIDLKDDSDLDQVVFRHLIRKEYGDEFVDCKYEGMTIERYYLELYKAVNFPGITPKVLTNNVYELLYKREFGEVNERDMNLIDAAHSKFIGNNVTIEVKSSKTSEFNYYDAYVKARSVKDVRETRMSNEEIVFSLLHGGDVNKRRVIMRSFYDDESGELKKLIEEFSLRTGRDLLESEGAWRQAVINVEHIGLQQRASTKKELTPAASID